MNGADVFEHLKAAEDDLSIQERERLAFHLLGGLLQQIHDGTASPDAAAVAIDRAHAWAIRMRTGEAVTAR